MSYLNDLKLKIYEGYKVSGNEASALYGSEFNELLAAADEIRKKFCGNSFDMCTIINAKSGRCSENCKYCAQSVYYSAPVSEYPLLSKEEIVSSAVSNYESGVLRFSVVTSGRNLSEREISDLVGIYRAVGEKCHISLCASHGLLTYDHFILLKRAGVSRYHNNLETSRRFFPQVCTTHTYDDKIETIKSAQRAGLEVCSGGIIGLGETYQDRIDMALEIRELGIRSVPVNILNPIKGTPFEHNPPLSEEEILRTIAVFRFLIPDGAIRLAGGRSLLGDKGRKAFLSGANAAISGNMLTTAGISTEEDKEIINLCGYRLEKL